jgi:putative drug exporter of the RND superfamily
MPSASLPADNLEDTPKKAFHSRSSLETRAIYRAGLAYGRFIHRFRWPMLALWIAVLVLSLFFMIQTVNLLGGGDTSITGSQSVQVDTLLSTQFHQNSSEVQVVFQAPSTLVTAPAYQQQLTTLQHTLRQVAQVQSVTVMSTGNDGKTTFLLVESRPNTDLPISDIRLLLTSTPGPAHTYLTGGPAVDDEIVQTSLNDVEHADLLALPIALLILIIVFGTLVAACMPLLLAIMSVPVAFALLYPIALHTQISTYVLSVASIVGLGIAIDYSLFIIRRFRDEMALGLPIDEAIGWTLATAGEAILFSGMVVMIGFIGLLLIGIPITTSVGIGGAFIVISAVLSALTFLPAVLCILGPRINAWRVPYLWRMTMAAEPGKHDKQEHFWRGLALRVMQRPILTIVFVCIILVGLGWPIFSIQIGSLSITSLPTSSEARQGLNVLDAQYPALNVQSIDLIVETTDHATILSADNLQRLASLSAWLSAQPHVTGVTSLMQLPASPGSPSLSTSQLITLYTSGAYLQNPALAQFVAANLANGMTHITVSSDTVLDSTTAAAQIDALRAHASGVVPGFKVLVGGNDAEDLDFDRFLFGNFPKAILFILLATLILLAIMFRSLLIPLKAVIMNIISISTAYGVLVFIFQWGNFSQILGFTSSGHVDDLIPIVLFCVLFGLSMDYEVFLLSRIREEWLRTKNNRLAVANGLQKTGSIITNAALLFMVVTISFIFTSGTSTKEMGVGMTMAILVDATVIRSLLVPATMRLLGRWNWWFPGGKLPPKPQETVQKAIPQAIEVL